MARPETLDDIETSRIEFGTIDLSKIGTDAALLKGYTALLEAIGKTPGAEVAQPYSSTMTFTRLPNAAEQAAQLKRAQEAWDESKKQYEKYAAVGSLEYTHLENMAEGYAKSEGLPYPPVHEPIRPFDAVIRDIDSVTAR
jgi:threonine aldolase